LKISLVKQGMGSDERKGANSKSKSQIKYSETKAKAAAKKVMASLLS
jgi:hypothetical protein